MLHYPEVQRKAQAELDRVLNHGERLPDYEDQSDLPYITAVMKEVLRWQPVTPIGTPCTLDLSWQYIDQYDVVFGPGIPHLASEDDVFEGYHIPKGAIVISNVWWVHFLLRDVPALLALTKELCV